MMTMSRAGVIGAMLIACSMLGLAGQAGAAECMVQNSSKLPIKVRAVVDGFENIPVSIPAQGYTQAISCVGQRSAVLLVETLGAPGVEACRIDVAETGARKIVFKAPVQMMPYKTYECVTE